MIKSTCYTTETYTVSHTSNMFQLRQKKITSYFFFFKHWDRRPVKKRAQLQRLDLKLKLVFNHHHVKCIHMHTLQINSQTVTEHPGPTNRTSVSSKSVDLSVELKLELSVESSTKGWNKPGHFGKNRCCSVAQSLSLWPQRLQHARPPCPSPSPRVCSHSRPLSQWCHPTISSSVVPFSSCLQAGKK